MLENSVKCDFVWKQLYYECRLMHSDASYSACPLCITKALHSEHSVKCYLFVHSEHS